MLFSSSMCLYLFIYFSEYFGHCHVLLGTFEKVSNFTGPPFITFNWLSRGVSGSPVCCCLSCSRMGLAQRLWSSQRSLTPGLPLGLVPALLPTRRVACSSEPSVSSS